MNYKYETRKNYDELAEIYDEKFEKYLELYLKDEIRTFLEKVPQGASILDLGSGPGNHAKRFQDAGRKVLCVDISKEMVKRCRARGLQAITGDFEELNLPENSYDAVYAYTSLLHIPKANLNKVLKQIHKVLKPNGTFALAMQEGASEDFRPDKDNPESRRWFALYTDPELREYLKPFFTINYFSRTAPDDHHVFLNYLSQPVK
jgi:ubiquinone/menaquinone biosynthesis C-methylase UbiE